VLLDDFTEADRQRIWEALSARDHRRRVYRVVLRWSWYAAAAGGVAFAARFVFG
jgi:hypothetical protein